MNRKIVLCVMLACGLAAVGCGGKKAEVSDSTSINPDAGPDGGDGMEPEANTGPTKYPTPPTQSPGERKPYKFRIWIKKAYVLPLSEDGHCWDKCTSETKKSLAQSLVNLATIDKPGDRFTMAAKAISGAIGAIDGTASLPDVYVHVDCGFDQKFATAKTSAEDRLGAQWLGANETLRLDLKDFCAISVWDADEDGVDEMIGATTVQLVKQADKNGKALLFGSDVNFGQVFLAELQVEALEQIPDQSGGGGGSGGGGSGGGSGGGGGGSGGGGGGGQSDPTPTPGAAWYSIEIVKANLKAKKEDGQPWDTKVPFIGKGDGNMPDPFVQAFQNGYQSENPFMTTGVAKDKNYYEWRSKGKAALKPNDKIHFMVWDKDMADNDLMGTCITEPMSRVQLGRDIVFRGCSQVDFLVVRIHRH